MSDDLVKRLRSEAIYAAPFRSEQLSKAANRIEELEAKLEKAVRLISEKPILATYEDDVQWQKYVIAELTGGKDE